MTKRHTYSARLLAAGLAFAVLVLPAAAHAWWRGGVFFGFPPIVPYYYVPPPVVYAPPAVVYPPPAYPPPPAYYPPPAAAQQPQEGASAAPACRAGAYVCPLEKPAPIGSPCSCPTNSGGRAAGRVG
jgi:hypothetical protein